MASAGPIYDQVTAAYHSVIVCAFSQMMLQDPQVVSHLILSHSHKNTAALTVFTTEIIVTQPSGGST